MNLLTVAFLTRFDTRSAHIFAAIGAVSAGAGVLVCANVTILRFNGMRPIGDRPLLLLGVLLILLGCQCLGLGLRAKQVVRGRPACDAPRSIARVVTGKLAPAGEHGHAEAVAGSGL